MFVVYALLGFIGGFVYARIPARPAAHEAANARRCSAHRGRIVYKLAALFSLDSFAGGFTVQSLLALWLFERFRPVASGRRPVLLLVGRAVRVLVSGRRLARAAYRAR